MDISTPKSQSGVTRVCEAVVKADPIIYVTKNTEYHMHGNLVVKVVDRRTGKENHAHQTMGLPIISQVRCHSNGAVNPLDGLPQVGNALLFVSPIPTQRTIITSVIVEIRKPANLLLAVA